MSLSSLESLIDDVIAISIEQREYKIKEMIRSNIIDCERVGPKDAKYIRMNEALGASFRAFEESK